MGLILFLISPILIIAFRAPWDSVSWPSDFYWALRNTIEQAIYSGIIASLLGFLGALGLCSYPSQCARRKWLEILLMAPTFLPAIFSLVICLTWIDPFPFGVLGISLVHGFMSFGLIAVVLAREVERDMGGVTQWALIEGASRLQVLVALVEPLLKKMLRFVFFVFVISFSSFTVPLVVGGGRGTTLEVLIYEKIGIDGNFTGAIALVLLQTLLVLFLSGIFIRKQNFSLHIGKRVQVLGSRALFWIFLGLSLILILGISREAFEGWQQAGALSGLYTEILELLWPSLGLAFCVVAINIVLFTLQISLPVLSVTQRVISGFLNFSPSMIGFATLLFWGSNFLSLALGLSLLFYPGLWRFFGHDHFYSLRGQIEMAELMGASRWQKVFQVIFPQMWTSLVLMSGVSVLWALGDFAISKLILGQESTLGILAGNLMSSYRTQASFFVTSLILVIGVVVCFGFYSVTQIAAGEYGSRSKSS